MYMCVYVTVHDAPLPAAIYNLSEVMKAVDDLINWRALGQELGLLHSTLEMIEHDSHNRIHTCKMMMLVAWLEQQDHVPQSGVPSWLVLRAALRRIGENELADRLLCK